MIDTLTTNGFLYRVNRHRAQMELYIQKRKALGYTIAITLVITIGVFCWHFKPVPFAHGQGVFLEKSSLDNKTPVVQTSHGDR